jgi:hypothetical protein
MSALLSLVAQMRFDHYVEHPRIVRRFEERHFCQQSAQVDNGKNAKQDAGRAS